MVLYFKKEKSSRKVNTATLYSGGLWFITWSVDSLYQSKFPVTFPRPSMEIPRYYLDLGHCRNNISDSVFTNHRVI